MSKMWRSLLTFSLFGLGLLAVSQQAAVAGAVYTPGNPYLIKTTWDDSDHTVSLEYCERGSEQDLEGFNCRTIGGKERYTMDELQAHRVRLLKNAQETLAIDIAIICTATAAGFLGGYLAGWAIYGHAAIETVWFAHFGGAGAMAATAVPIKLSEKLSPAKKYRKVRRLDGVFLTANRDLVVEDVAREALALEQILVDL